MRWKVKTPDEGQWHTHFCWWPTRIDDEWVWLERVERRLSAVDPYGGVCYWDYRRVSA